MFAYLYVHVLNIRMFVQTWLVLFLGRYILFLFINIGIIIFVSVILKKIKIIFTPIQLRCCKNSQRISSNSSNISDYVNIVEITSTQHYTRIAQNRFPEQKMLGNNTMETASTEVTSIRRRNNVEKSTWRTHRKSNPRRNFHVESI